MSGERCAVWDDPNVEAALAAGRELSDIAVLNCTQCGKLGYYNQGSHFACRHCGASFYVATEDEDEDVSDCGAVIRIDCLLTMEDVARRRHA